MPVTEVGFGAAQLGNLNRATTDDESTSAVHAARAAGSTYFDMAPHYGPGRSTSRFDRSDLRRDGGSRTRCTSGMTRCPGPPGPSR
ncbi:MULTISPECIES: aldo/keto reductase [unclassified Microbacterium]|uniref:aldo/keto reductase n=1 Tax=unclassified Microbacterium TaxID=2609290 RepID=UPI003C2E3F29